MRCRLLAFILVQVIGIASASAQAIDREQPIDIEADNLTVDEPSGVYTYSGSVQVNQGTLSIFAEVVQIQAQDEEIVRVVASVGPEHPELARYEQLRAGEIQKVRGEARTITYHVSEERLEFSGEARLSQGSETTVSGDIVNYDARAGRVQASSNGNTRVRTTINQGAGEQ